MSQSHVTPNRSWENVVTHCSQAIGLQRNHTELAPARLAVQDLGMLRTRIFLRIVAPLMLGEIETQ